MDWNNFINYLVLKCGTTAQILFDIYMLGHCSETYIHYKLHSRYKSVKLLVLENDFKGRSPFKRGTALKKYVSLLNHLHEPLPHNTHLCLTLSHALPGF